jgi:cytochrome b561
MCQEDSMTGSRVPATLFAVTLVLVAAQFALAGDGAFSTIRTRAGDPYGAHMILGLVIAALTLVDLIAVLASRSLRSRPGTLWPAVALVVLAVALAPLLAEAGKNAPAVGALHALNGVLVLALAGWLLGATTRRRVSA